MGCAWSTEVDLVGDGVRIHTIKELAQGGFSQVFLCEDVDSREKYAVKKIQITQPAEETKVRFEVCLLFPIQRKFLFLGGTAQNGLGDSEHRAATSSNRVRLCLTPRLSLLQ